MLKVDEGELIILTQVLIMPSVIAMAWAVRLLPHLPRILFARFLLYYRRCSVSFSPDRCWGAWTAEWTALRMLTSLQRRHRDVLLRATYPPRG